MDSVSRPMPTPVAGGNCSAWPIGSPGRWWADLFTVGRAARRGWRGMRKLKSIIRWHLQKSLLRIVLRPDAHAESAVFGDAIMPTTMIGRDAITYCAGVGED